MTVFPAQYSLLSSAPLGSYIASNYGLDGFTCRLLVHNLSDTYILEGSDGRYIFKVYRVAHRSPDEVLGEVALLNALAPGGVSVAFAVKDLQGRQVQQFLAAEGIRCGVLFMYAPGQAKYPLSDLQLQTLGREVAKMHNITCSLQLPYSRPVYNVETTLTRPLASVKELFKDLPDDYTFLQQLAAKVAGTLKQFDTGKFSYGYCHYDLIPKNYHFDGETKITFFDFDCTGKGYLVNDLMTFYIQLGFGVNAGKITQEKADTDFRIIIEAYREIRAVSDEELAAIPYLGVMFWMYFLEVYVLNFEDWSNTFLTPQFVKDRMALIRNWVDWYCRF